MNPLLENNPLLEIIRLDVSSEFSARQRSHMKNQALFSLKDKRKNIKMSSAAILIWCFKVKYDEQNRWTQLHSLKYV